MVKLEARQRAGTGKSYTRKARASGWIPAVYYGHNEPVKHIEVSARDFGALVRAKQTTHLIDLGLEDGGKSVAIIKEIQKDVIRRGVYKHVDFQSVSMDEVITVDVPVEIVGTPVGVKDEDGLLEHPVRSVNVQCLPGNIPEKVSIDVSALHVGDSIHVKDVTFENFSITDAPEEVLAVVTHPKGGAGAEEQTEAEEGAAQ
ncbi:MAG: 50S ribosomal protein L25 [Fibrobacterota bacterium]